MKLFDDYEAVKFPEENAILITHNQYLYYIYNSKYKYWYRHKNAGNDHLTVSNYPNVSRKELAAAMGGSIPKKKTDLLRILSSSQLTINDMITLLEEDYPDYMHDYMVRHSVSELVCESDVREKSYEALRKLLDDALENKQDYKQVRVRVRELSLSIMGRDICSNEIGIVDGHDNSSYFWIMPVRILDYADTNRMENVAEMRSNEISIEEDDVYRYLMPFLDKCFDNDLKANRNRAEYFDTDDDGNEQIIPVEGFAWYLTHNFFTYDSVEEILEDIRATINDLASGKDNDFIAQIRERNGFSTSIVVSLDPPEDGMTCRFEKTEVTSEMIIDFYRRFIYRMEYMVRVGREKGYDLISFMGP